MPAFISKTLTIKLPYPLSVNGVWRINSRGKGIFLVERAKKYHREVAAIVNSGPKIRFTQDDRLELKIEVRRKDARKKTDISNCIKLLEDALVSSKLIYDDSNVDVLIVLRGAIDRPHGSALVTITTLPPKDLA